MVSTVYFGCPFAYAKGRPARVASCFQNPPRTLLSHQGRRDGMKGLSLGFRLSLGLTGSPFTCCLFLPCGYHGQGLERSSPDSVGQQE